MTCCLPVDGVRRRIARSVPSLLALMVFTSIVGMACGGSSPASPSGSSQGGASPAAATSAPAKKSGILAANLTFTGSVAGAVTEPKAAKGSAQCGGGTLELGITVAGHDYDLLVINASFKGPGKYEINGASSATVVVLSDALYGGQNAYTGTTGTVNYSTDRSLTLDVDLIGANSQKTHVSGSASCA
jgi:hypothetical protein